MQKPSGLFRKILRCDVNEFFCFRFHAMCKPETFKTLTTIKKLEIKENSFYLRFYRSTLRQAKCSMSN